METMKDFEKKYEETNGQMATIASCFKIKLEEANIQWAIENWRTFYIKKNQSWRIAYNWYT